MSILIAGSNLTSPQIEDFDVVKGGSRFALKTSGSGHVGCRIE
jgi:hypothetical protein